MNHLKTFIAVSTAVALMSFSLERPDNVDLRMVSQIKQEGFEHSKVMETLFQLTDVSGPRLTGSTGLKNAQNWAQQQLKDWGLTNAQLEPWGAFGKGWETKKCYVAMTAPYYQSIIAVPKAWTPGTNGPLNASVVLVKVDNEQDLDQYKGKLKDKIVVMQPSSIESALNFKPDATRVTDEELVKMMADPHTEDGEPVAAGPRPAPVSYRALMLLRQKTDSFIRAEGALAVLGTRRGTMGTLFTSNGASYAWNAKPVLPEVEMGMESVARIVRLLQANKEVKVEMDLKTDFLKTDSMAYNVVAEIPGTDKNLKQEVVMLGAHLDSWHAATGATDNGTGVSVMMEAVRILKALDIHPRRTIRIALWSGEEQGILGSKNYVKKHFGDAATMALKPEHEQISAYFNLDNGAGKIRGIFLQGNDAVGPIFKNWLAPFNDLGAKTVTIRTTGSTDHIPFDAVGIPAFQFIQDPLEYFTRTHHTNMDTYDRINKNDLMQASIIVASFIYNTAMRDDLLPRKALPKAK